MVRFLLLFATCAFVTKSAVAGTAAAAAAAAGAALGASYFSTIKCQDTTILSKNCELPPPPHRSLAVSYASNLHRESCVPLAIRGGGGKGGGKEEEGKLKNSAIIFIKPHANTPTVQNLVEMKLHDMIPNLQIKSTKDLGGKEIDEKQLVDKHYYSIASKATMLEPKDMNVPKDKFEEFFGESWDKVLAEKRAVNALHACKRFDCDASTLYDAWKEAEQRSKVVKLGGGFYCGLVSVNDKQPLYVFNAFFMTMRSKFVGDSDTIRVYEIEWDETDLSWADFRGKVLGPTDPLDAPRGSIRRTILDRYKKLGLTSRPNKSDNGVHGSASPFEGLVEKVNWLGKSFQGDDFGRTLLSKGIRKKGLQEWSLDPRVKLPDGSWGSLFDALEDLNASECLEKMVEIEAAQRK